MPPPPHPVLAPYLTASHLSAVDAYAAGPGLRATAPTSPSGVKKAKKTRAAYLSRLRRAAYMEMLESACEEADREEEQISARLEAEQEERFVLLHNIRALEGEITERIAEHRSNFGAAEVLALDSWATNVVAAADFELTKVATAQGVEVCTVNSGSAEVGAADVEVTKVAAVERAKHNLGVISGITGPTSRSEMLDVVFEAAEVDAANFSAADVLASDMRVTEVAAAVKAEKRSSERSGRTVSGPRLAPHLLADTDFDFDVFMRGMQCTASA